MRHRSLGIAALAALIASTAMVGSVSGAEVLREHIYLTFDDPEDSDFCGFTVVVHIDGTVTTVFTEPATGDVLVGVESGYFVVFENPDSGRTVSFRGAGVVRESEGVFTFSGLHDLWVMPGFGALMVRAFRVYATDDGFTVTGVERFAPANTWEFFCSLLA